MVLVLNFMLYWMCCFSHGVLPILDIHDLLMCMCVCGWNVCVCGCVVFIFWAVDMKRLLAMNEIC